MEFKEYGGQFVDNNILQAVKEVEKFYNKYCNDEAFLKEYHTLLVNYANRPSPLYFASNLTKEVGGAQIYLKREDLNFTGAHKINNVLGQALLAKKMGKQKLIAETGAGQHGVAVATAAALLNLECEIHMGAIDISKQALNVYKMKLLGAKVVSVHDGLKTLKEAVDSALVTWSNEINSSYYLIGSVVGPHPYQTMVRDFQKIIGSEIKQQSWDTFGKNPNMIIACVGGGSNAMGAFYEFLDDLDVELIAVEAAGLGIETGHHSAALAMGRKGIIHGMKSKVLLNDDHTIAAVYSISAGLDYPSVGPEVSMLATESRIQTSVATDQEAIDAFKLLAKTEGILPAIESAHALSEGIKRAKVMKKDKIIIINLSGRGEKDVNQVLENEETKVKNR